MQLLVGAGYQSFSASLLDSFTGGYLYNSGLNNLLAADATALSEMGIYESDVGSLFDFEFGKDGLAVFDQRYHQGAFGYGTSHAFDITAQMIGGVPTIFYPDGSTRILNTPSPSQPNQYLGAVGDYGVVSIAVDGTWTLTESNGVLFHFKPDPLPTSTKGLILDYIQDLNGNRITLSYTNDLVTSAVDSFGNTITFTYDALGHITQATDPVGRVTTYTYDILGDSQHSTFLTSITNSSGMTSLTWNEGGPHGVGYFDDSCVLSYCEPAIGVKTITYPDGTHTYFTYDALGRLASQYRDGQTEVVTYAYTASGAVEATDALGNTTTTAFNQQGGVGKFTDPLGMLSQFSYDPENKLSSVLGPLGTSASLSYDTHGNAAGLRDPLDNQDSLAYVAYGSLQSFTDPSGNVVAYGYDSNFDPTSVTYPDGSATQATYDARGNVISSTNRRGHTTTYTYDAHNLRTSKTFASGAQVLYTYDGHRNLQSVTNSAGTTMYTYDSADRLTGIVYPNGQSIQYSYNAGGQRIGMSDSTGFTVTYSYDAAGRPSQVSNGGARIVAYTYDAAGRLSQKTLGNGTYTTFAYDAAGNLLHLINYSSGGSVISEYDSTYDGMGRRIGMNSPAGSWTYGYDADSQVTSVTLPGGSVQYTYDAAGNRTASVANGSATSFLVNNLDQYTQAGANTYNYDADGNLIAGGGWTYAYDDENRLISAGSATDTWSYQYDGLGNRVSATHNGSVTQYLNEPSGFGNVEAEFDGAGHLTGHYTYGLDLAGFVPAAGPAAYYHFDPAGNTAQMTNSSGSVVDSYSYLPFGEKLTSIAGVPNPYTYVGEFGVMDEGSGLYFMRNRWYNPALGRFVQLDPIGFTSDSNLYRYAANSPLRFIDPSGTAITTAGVLNAGNHVLNLAGSLPGGAGIIVNAVNLPLSINSALNANKHQDTLGVIHDTAMAITRPLGFLPPEGPVAPLVWVAKYSGPIDEGSQLVFNAYWINKYRPKYPFGPGPTGPNLNRPIVHSHDPNGKLTTGFGDQGYIPPGVAIPYTIYFENQASATAPAQKVVVTDALPTNLDWSTVQLNQIGFNNVTINVPIGLQSYTGQANVSTDPNPVNVSAALNPNTGMLTWTMQSVDPTTGSTPQNPLAGFLPPNTASNQGTGFVTFTVSPKTSLGNGAAITNQASIVFDVNAAIATNTVTNMIDSTAPTSAVNPLPAITASTSVLVSWAGSDPSGSGIAGYNLFFSIDGGAYAVWMPNTTQTSATFTAIAGHTYSFYSLAVNNVGTIQTIPGPSQTTTVLQPSGPGPCTITGDANASVADVQSMINQALGAAKALNDLNHDGAVNVIDVQIVIDAVVGLGCTAQ
jgi:RHS repeat-associated protein